MNIGGNHQENGENGYINSNHVEIEELNLNQIYNSPEIQESIKNRSKLQQLFKRLDQLGNTENEINIKCKERAIISKIITIINDIISEIHSYYSNKTLCYVRIESHTYEFIF